MNEGTHPHVATQRTLRSLLHRVAKMIAANGQRTLATVTATAPFAVVVDGAASSVPAHHLDSYTPAVNDRVWAEVIGNQVMVHGTFT